MLPGVCAPQHLAGFARRHRAGKPETLRLRAAQRCQRIQLRLRFDTLGDHIDVQHLAQTDDAALDAKAEAAAERLGLAYERHATGYGELAQFIRAA